MKKLLFILLIFTIMVGCEEDSKENCDPAVCNNYHECLGNKCVLSDNRCDSLKDCEDGFECNAENFCIDPLAPCKDQTCGGNGECVVENNEAKCNCSENYHAEGLDCVSNSKKVDCKDNSPENGTSTITEVDVTWDKESNSWSEATDCEWSCETLYEKQNNSCIITCEDSITDADDNYAYYRASELNLTEDVTTFNNLTTSIIDTETDDCVKAEDWYVIKDLKVGDIIQVDLNFILDDNGENLDLELYIGGIDNLVASSYNQDDTESVLYAIQEKDIPKDKDSTDLHINVRAGENHYSMTVTKKNPCTAVDCGNDRKICVADSLTEHSCKCSDGYFTDGDNCITPCDEIDCSGDHKYCHIIDQSNAECRCEDEYSLNGDSCELLTIANTCEDITFTINSSGTFVGSTFMKDNNYEDTDCDNMGYAFDGLDVAYKIELETGDHLNLTLHQTSTEELEDIAFYVVKDCNDSAKTCVTGSDLGIGSADESSSYTVVESGLYYIIVDSITEDVEMPDYYDFELTVDLQ